MQGEINLLNKELTNQNMITASQKNMITIRDKKIKRQKWRIGFGGALLLGLAATIIII